MDKVCLIKQPAGIGDIIFCQKIAKTIQQTTEYKRVIWPVSNQYDYIDFYMGSSDLVFCNESSDFPYKELYGSSEVIQTNEVYYLPLQNADSMLDRCLCHGNHLAHGHIKYNICRLPYSDWKDFFEFKRDFEREELLKKSLSLQEGEPYVVVNRNYGTYPSFKTRDDIFIDSGIRQIAMDFYENVNLFDWVGILLGATEIHTVETSLCYILEKLNVQNVSVYSRYPNTNDDFSYMRDHCNSKWIFIP